MESTVSGWLTPHGSSVSLLRASTSRTVSPAPAKFTHSSRPVAQASVRVRSEAGLGVVVVRLAQPSRRSVNSP